MIETGVRHGTVTVLHRGEPLEITTYRRDGIYADHRHPVQVTFSKTLADDLSRRDFTVNAMAYHPKRGLVDLFGGQKDLSRGVIACVGDAPTRFEEDGLRILRALRFASVLGFSLDPGTARAVHDRRSLLDFIAAERIREEWDKLLLGKNAVPILRDYADVVVQIFPEVAASVGFPQRTKYHCYDVYEHTLQAIGESKPDLRVRLALFFHDLGKPAVHTEEDGVDHFKGHAAESARLCDAAMARLRYDNATREEVCFLVERHDFPIPCTDRAVRRLLMKVPPETVLRLLEIKRCDRLAHAPDFREQSPEQTEIPRLMEEIRARDDCISLRSLAVRGDDLIALGYRPGKALGDALQALLDAVVDGDLPNERETLLREAEKRK